MIIIRLRDGLGNQMFQYAFFRQMCRWHGVGNVKLDADTFHWRLHNGLEIDRVFDIDLANDTVPPSVSLRYADVSHNLRHRLLRRLRGNRHFSYRNWRELEWADYQALQDVYLEGYWNEEIYFAGVANDIRACYRFRHPPAGKDAALLQQIEAANSVAIHVRRGDFTRYPRLFPVCQPAYYQAAVGHLREQCGAIKLFVFSDDMAWCRQHLSFLGNVLFCDSGMGSPSGRDMYLMSRCRHNIIANSTFSWWAAWLNDNPEKIVLYPSSARLTFRSMPAAWQCIDVDSRTLL